MGRSLPPLTARGQREVKAKAKATIIALRYGVAAPLAVLCTSSRALNVI